MKNLSVLIGMFFSFTFSLFSRPMTIVLTYHKAPSAFEESCVLEKISEIPFAETSVSCVSNQWMVSITCDETLGDEVFSHYITEMENLQSFSGDLKALCKIGKPSIDVNGLSLKERANILEEFDQFLAWFSGETTTSNEPYYYDRLTNFHPLSVLPISHHAKKTEPFFTLTLSDRDQKNTYQLISRLGEESVYKLLLKKKKMDRLGTRVEHIHPLRFVGYILSVPRLKNAMRLVNKSYFKWRRFVDGFSKNMRHEASQDNIEQHIPGFCKQVRADEKLVHEYIHKRQYEGLLKALILQ